MEASKLRQRLEKAIEPLNRSLREISKIKTGITNLKENAEHHSAKVAADGVVDKNSVPDDILAMFVEQMEIAQRSVEKAVYDHEMLGYKPEDSEKVYNLLRKKFGVYNRKIESFFEFVEMS